MSDKKAGRGQLWVCMACGKTSPTKFGLQTKGWDASCMLNSMLCKKSSLTFNEGKRVTNIKEGGIIMLKNSSENLEQNL